MLHLNVNLNVTDYQNKQHLDATQYLDIAFNCYI